jgi:hypothetical protein
VTPFAARLTRHVPLTIFLALAACTPPVRQFALKDQPLSCEQANRYALDSLTALGYTVSRFTPATPGGPGVLGGATNDGAKSATVTITCSGAGPTIEASEDGKLLGQIDFKRAFYLAFTGRMTQQGALAKVAQQQAALPLAERKQQGVEVLVTPMPGMEARLDFATDLTAAGVLPVRVVIHNRTEHRYRIDPLEIVLVRSDSERVRPLTLAAVLERVKMAPITDPSADNITALPRQLEAKQFTTTEMRRDSAAEGYLFYPLGTYRNARVLATEAESDETEGFVVEF